MKRYILWFFLMAKRMLKKPAFLLLLISLPVLSVALSRAEQTESTGMGVGLLMETQSDMDAAAGAEKWDGEEWQEDFFNLLQEQDSIFAFRIYKDKETMIQDVEKGELYCAFSFPADFREKLRRDDWRESITLYCRESADLSQMAKERIASVVFTLFSEECYVNYIQESDAFAAVRTDPESEEELLQYAQTAYKTNLVNGSTFAFAYEGEAFGGLTGGQMPVFPLRGVLAVCIFLSGLCGLLTDWKDREEKRFVRLAPNWMTTIFNIWIPTIYTSLMTLAALYLAGQAGNIGRELLDFVFYQFLIVAYCCMIRAVVRKQEAITALIPILTLASMVCAPVWIRLAVYLPVFQVLEKLFPVTYYLRHG